MGNELIQRVCYNGVSLFHAQESDNNIVDATLFKRHVLKELAYNG